MALPRLTIIRDTREQEGWVFDPEEKRPGKIQILGTVTQGLDAGDYSMIGYQHLLRIERKNGFCELFGNMTPKEHKDRFEREMEKLKSIPYKYLLIEGVLSSDILGLSVPQFYKGPPASAVIKWLLELQIDYGINVLFVGDAGKKVARYIFELVARRENGQE
jgi:hypothetical protein